MVVIRHYAPNGEGLVIFRRLFCQRWQFQSLRRSGTDSVKPGLCWQQNTAIPAWTSHWGSRIFISSPMENLSHWIQMLCFVESFYFVHPVLSYEDQSLMLQANQDTSSSKSMQWRGMLACVHQRHGHLFSSFARPRLNFWMTLSVRSQWEMLLYVPSMTSGNHLTPVRKQSSTVMWLPVVWTMSGRIRNMMMRETMLWQQHLYNKGSLAQIANTTTCNISKRSKKGENALTYAVCFLVTSHLQ